MVNAKLLFSTCSLFLCNIPVSGYAFRLSSYASKTRKSLSSMEGLPRRSVIGEGDKMRKDKPTYVSRSMSFFEEKILNNGPG